MHGGPVFGLITRAVEQLAPDADFVPTRFTFDLSRAVPLVPVTVEAKILQKSSRLCLVQASLRSDGEAYVSASVLLLRQSDAGVTQHASTRPSGPDGLHSETLMRGNLNALPNGAVGYHTRVETRWPERSEDQPVAIWFRMPLQLVEGEEPTALQRAVQLSDFANAVASISQRDRGVAQAAFINVDATIYCARKPVGEWFCIQEESVAVDAGISVATCKLFDTEGQFGRIAQGRLANRMRR